MKAKFKFIIKLALGICLLVVIFSWIDIKQTIDHIKKMSIIAYIFVLAGHFILMAIRSRRWQLICLNAGVNFPYKASLCAYTAAFAFGTFTPGQAGDFVKIFFVKQYSNDSKKLLGTVIVDRLWDFIFLGIIAMISFAFVFSSYLLKYIPWVLAIAAIAAALLIILLRTTFAKTILNKFPWIFLDINKISFYSFLATIVQFSRWMLLAYAFNLKIILSSFIATLGSVIALLPISISGLGSRDIAMAYLFEINGMPASAGVAFSMMMFNAYLIGALGGLIVFIFIKNKDKLEVHK